MPNTTYFANDLTGIGNMMLQNEAQRIAAENARRQYFAQLNETAAKRYAADKEAQARMFQSSAYRDVGMGENSARLKGIEAGERIGNLPYEKIPKAQEEYFKFLGEHPELAGSPQARMEFERFKRDTQSGARVATNKLQAALPAIRDEVAQFMDSFGKRGTGILGTGVGAGLWQGEAASLADRMAKGTFTPSPNDPPVVREGWKLFNDRLAAAKVASMEGIEPVAGAIGFNPAGAEFFSGFDTNKIGQLQNQPTLPAIPNTEGNSASGTIPSWWPVIAPGAAIQAEIMKRFIQSARGRPGVAPQAGPVITNAPPTNVTGRFTFDPRTGLSPLLSTNGVPVAY